MSTESANPPPYVPVLSEAGERLLGGIDALPSREGSVPATRQLRNCIMHAVRLHPEVIPRKWTSEASQLHDELRRAKENGSAALGALSAHSDASATYKAFATATRSTLSASHASSVDAALGLIVVTEASLGQAVSVHASHYLTPSAA